MDADGDGVADDDGDEEDDDGVEGAVAALREEVGSIGGAVKELAAVVGELRTNPPAALLPPTGGAAGDGDGGAPQPMGLEEAKAMRKVVEALDAKLTRKLQTIDERLAKRDLAKKTTANRSGPGRATGNGPTGNGQGATPHPPSTAPPPLAAEGRVPVGIAQPAPPATGPPPPNGAAASGSVEFSC